PSDTLSANVNVLIGDSTTVENPSLVAITSAKTPGLEPGALASAKILLHPSLGSAQSPQPASSPLLIATISWPTYPAATSEYRIGMISYIVRALISTSSSIPA